MGVFLLITVGLALRFVRQLRLFFGRTLVLQNGDLIEVTTKWLRRRSVRRIPLADVRSFEVNRWETGILHGASTYAWDVDAALEGDSGRTWSIVEGLPTLEHARRIARELRYEGERSRPTGPANE